MAPPSMASGTPQSPIDPSAIVSDFPFRKPMRPYSVSLARTTTKMMPCSTSTVASGRPSRRCSRPPLALDAAEQDRHRE